MQYTNIIDSMVWSYSRLSAYETCPYMWEKKYIYGEEEIPKFFTKYGSMMHKLIEKYLRKELDDDTITDYYNEHYLAEMNSAPSEKIYDTYYNQGLDYVTHIATLLPKRHDIEIEQVITLLDL